MDVKQKDLLMDLFAKYAKEYPEYDDHFINLFDLEKIVSEFLGDSSKSEPIEKICKNCDYFQPTKNENGVGWCVFEVGIDKAKFGNETCADFSHT